MDHAVEFRDFLVGVGDDGVLHGGVAVGVDVGDPVVVVFFRVHRQGDWFDVPLCPFLAQLCDATQFGGADGGEVGWV